MDKSLVEFDEGKSNVSPNMDVESGSVAPTTWKDWLFRALALFSVFTLVSIFTSPMFAIIGVSLLIIVLLCASGFALYRYVKGEVSRARLIWTFLAIALFWVITVANFIESAFGYFEWSLFSHLWEIGLLWEATSQSQFSSLWAVVIIYMSIMLAFKSKRNPKSIINVYLYWAIILCILMSFKPMID